MEAQEIRSIVVDTLKQIAPEVEESELRADTPLRNQVDLDSMDFLNFVIALHKRFGIDIPESDYARIQTLDAIVTYVSAKGE